MMRNALGFQDEGSIEQGMPVRWANNDDGWFYHKDPVQEFQEKTNNFQSLSFLHFRWLWYHEGWKKDIIGNYGITYRSP